MATNFPSYTWFCIQNTILMHCNHHFECKSVNEMKLWNIESKPRDVQTEEK